MLAKRLADDYINLISLDFGPHLIFVYSLVDHKVSPKNLKLVEKTSNDVMSWKFRAHENRRARNGSDMCEN